MTKPTFAELLAAAKAKTALPTAEPKPEPALVEEPTPIVAVVEPVAIPKVAISADVIKMSNAVVAAGTVADDITADHDLSLIKEKINRLQTVDGFELKTAMDGLKSLILANPAACAQLLPEDVGDMVLALRRMTGNQEAAAMSAPRRAKAAPKEPALDATALEDLLNDLL